MTARVIPLPGQRPKESWEFIREWADQRGWGSYKCAGAMILAATPQERKRLPDQHALAGHWRRWLKGQHIPDAHMSDPNVNGFYRPIIARMMGTTPERIWPARRWAHVRARDMLGELRMHRQRTAGKLDDLRRQLEELHERVRRMQELEDTISKLEAEVSYLDAMLAVQAPDVLPEQQVR
jgi:hypothetical protein